MGSLPPGHPLKGCKVSEKQRGPRSGEAWLLATRTAHSRGRRNPLAARPEAGRRRSRSAPRGLSRCPGWRLAAARRTPAPAERAGPRSRRCDPSAGARAVGSSRTRLCLGSRAGAFALPLTVRSTHTAASAAGLTACLQTRGGPLPVRIPAAPPPALSKRVRVCRVCV